MPRDTLQRKLFRRDPERVVCASRAIPLANILNKIKSSRDARKLSSVRQILYLSLSLCLSLVLSPMERLIRGRSIATSCACVKYT